MKNTPTVIRWQFGCDLCVYWQINRQHLRERHNFRVFSFTR